MICLTLGEDRKRRWWRPLATKKGVKQRRFGAWMNPTSMKLDRTSPQFDFLRALEPTDYFFRKLFWINVWLYFKSGSYTVLQALLLLPRGEKIWWVWNMWGRWNDNVPLEIDLCILWKQMRKCFFFFSVSLSLSLPLSRPLQWHPKPPAFSRTGCAWFADWLLSRRFFPWGIRIRPWIFFWGKFPSTPKKGGSSGKCVFSFGGWCQVWGRVGWEEHGTYKL